MDSVACPSVSLCVAGDYAGNVLVSTNPTGGASAWKVINIDPSAHRLSIACPSTTFCVAVDANGNALTTTDPTGGPSAWSRTAIDGYELTGVNCPTTALCVAVDGHGRVLTGALVTEEEPTTKEEPTGTGGDGGSSTTSSTSSTTTTTSILTNGGGLSSITGPSISSAQLLASLKGQLVPSGKAAKIGALLKSGGLTMPFRALEAGSLSVQWYEVPVGAKLAKQKKVKPVLAAQGKLGFSRAGIGQLKIRLTSNGKRLLSRAKRVGLTVKGAFVGSGGATVNSTSAVVVRR
jgi:hypothetical protein